MANRKKRRGHSDIIADAVLVVSLFLFIYTLVVIWVFRDTSPLMYLIPSVSALTTAVLSFYMKKSEKENIAKIEKNYIPNYEYMTDFEREMAIHKLSRGEGGEHEQ